VRQNAHPGGNQDYSAKQGRHRKRRLRHRMPGCPCRTSSPPYGDLEPRTRTDAALALLTGVLVLRIGIEIMPTAWRGAVIAVTSLGRDWLPRSCHRGHRIISTP
jgi:hypothetical protein